MTGNDNDEVETFTDEDDRGFPWGERNPATGYKVGDYVGLIHSDHGSYLFDNPKGTVYVIEVDGKEVEEVSQEELMDDEHDVKIGVAVQVDVRSDKVFLIARKKG